MISSFLQRRLRTLRLLSAFVAFVGCAAPQVAAPATEASAAARASEPAREERTPGLFLYAVHGPGGTSHLLGTMHVGFGFEEVLTEAARARFEASRRVMIEADLGAADPQRMMQGALLPPDQSLRTLLAEPAWSALVARLGSQIPEQVLERLKPWLPAVMLGLADIQVALKELKPDGQQRMMDLELEQAAKRRGMSLGYLETVEEQLRMFESVPIDEQIRELRRALAEGAGESGRKMLEAFAAGDDEALAAHLFDPDQLAQAPGFFEAVLYERNERWLPLLERELAQGDAFIAVGAAHLLGERGVLASLKARGYRVERVGAPLR